MTQIKVGNKTCKFDSSNHTYTVDGKEVPGTTTITGMIDKSDPLMWWVAGQAKDHIEENMEPGKKYDEVEIKDLAEGAKYAFRKSGSDATTIGTIVHKFCEDWIKAEIHQGKYGPEKPSLPENKKAVQSDKQFLKWTRENDVDFEATEQIIYHPRFQYAGTYDAKATVNGDRLIIDFKTSKSIYNEHHLQATAYLKAERLKDDENIDGYGLIRFHKDSAGVESVIETADRETNNHWEAFRAALQLYKWDKRQ